MLAAKCDSVLPWLLLLLQLLLEVLSLLTITLLLTCFAVRFMEITNGMHPMVYGSVGGRGFVFEGLGWRGDVEKVRAVVYYLSPSICNCCN